MAFIARLAAPLMLLAALACGDSAGDPAGTGTVSLFVTDAPSDAFEEINLTIDEIVLLGGGPPVTIFEGEQTLDLKSLEHFSDLFVVAEEVPARRYSKIRLGVTAIELVDHDGEPEIIAVDPPADGRIDLNPHGPFEVQAGGHLVIEIDVDAEKSIHLHETGSGEYRFRPEVFVTIGEAETPLRLTRLHGYLSHAEGERRARLCPLPGGTSAPMVMRVRPESAAPGGGGEDGWRYLASRPRSWYDARGYCVVVELDESTGVFDANGDPIDFEALEVFSRPFPSPLVGIPITPDGAIEPGSTRGYVTYDPDPSACLTPGPINRAPEPDEEVYGVSTHEATVIGHFVLSDQPARCMTPEGEWIDNPFWRNVEAPPELVLQAAVVEEGPIGTFLQLRGVLEASAQDPDDVLRFLPGPGQGFGDSTWLPALLQQGTHLFDRHGDELFEDELAWPVAAEIDGVFGAVDDDGRLFYKTALIVVDEDAAVPSSD